MHFSSDVARLIALSTSVVAAMVGPDNVETTEFSPMSEPEQASSTDSSGSLVLQVLASTGTSTSRPQMPRPIAGSASRAPSLFADLFGRINAFGIVSVADRANFESSLVVWLATD
jgi:hypothetical protein